MANEINCLHYEACMFLIKKSGRPEIVKMCNTDCKCYISIDFFMQDMVKEAIQNGKLKNILRGEEWQDH